MKNVTGKIESTKPISLSKAANIISKFVSSDNGAPYSVSIYLQRASDSFNELVQFHKELKGRKSDRKHKKHRDCELKDENPIRVEQDSREFEEERAQNVAVIQKRKKEREPIKVEPKYEDPDEFVEDRVVKNVGDGRKHEREKNSIKVEENSCGIEDGEVGNVEESVRKRDKKRKKRDGVEREGRGSFGLEEEEKRKSVEVGEEQVGEFEEQSDSKKKTKRNKKRKIEGDE